MSFLRFSVSQRRHSLYAPRKSYRSLINIHNSNLLPKLDLSSPEKENNCQKKEACNISSCCTTKVYNGEPLIDNDMPKSISFSSYKKVLQNEINIPSIPSLPLPNDSAFDKIFIEKIKICSIIFNFTQSQIQLKGKKEKSKALNEIYTLLCKNSDASLLADQEKCLILEMIMINIFDQDPFISSKKFISSTIKLNFSECSWEHLSIVFKILNKFVLLYPEKCQIDLVKKGIRLMNIPDINERENLVLFLQNYTKVHQNQFNYIWKELKLALTNARHGIYTEYCIDPIMSYLSHLMPSNTATFYFKYLSQILFSHLLPLFHNEHLLLYFTKLSNLIIQITKQNYNDQLNVIQYLLKYFPIQCGQKQPLFVSVLISITSTMQSDQLNPIAPKIFNFIAMSLQSPNFKLADSALSFLMKPNMKPIIFSNYESAMKILYEPLKWSSSFYWEQSVKDQCAVAFTTLINAKLEFQKSISISDYFSENDNNHNNENNKENKKTDNNDLAKNWAFISRTAAKKDRSIDLTKSLSNIQIEFVKEKLYDDYNMVKSKSASNINNKNNQRTVSSKSKKTNFY